MKFKNFLINVNLEEFTEQETPPPAAPAPGPEAAPPAMPMATPPMPPPPMGGGLDAGLGGVPPASTCAQAPQIKIKTSNVWEVLKVLLSEKPEDQSTLNTQDVLKNGDKPQHLMGI